MSTDPKATTSAAPSPAPAMLRHEGPLRVSVPEGGHSALSASGVVGGPRLRPALGPVPPGLSDSVPPSGLGGGLRRLRSPLAPTGPTTGAGAAAPRRRFQFTPPDQGPDEAERARTAADLQRRMDRLAQGNVDVALQVSRLEAEIPMAALPRRSPE